MQTIGSIWSSLDTRVQVHQSHVLAVLEEKLQAAVAIVSDLDAIKAVEPSLKTLIGSRGDT